jgi:CRP/FNR family transcriptional regulator, cyclic AMP receptor protein
MEFDSRLFDGVRQDEVSRLLEVARRRQFSRDEVVFHSDDPADTLHLISDGRFAVRVVTPYGDVVTLAVLTRGEIFGEMALLEVGARRSATVVSLESSETLSIRKGDFDRLRHAHPAVTDALLAILSHKVRRYTNQVIEALYAPAELRVVRRLLELVDVYDDGESSVEVPLSQEDLAGLAGTSRATVNRVLRKEEERGSLELGRAKTVVKDRKALESRARIEEWGSPNEF